MNRKTRFSLLEMDASDGSNFNDSFYRSLERSPNRCFYCTKICEKRDSLHCKRCSNSSDFKNSEDYKSRPNEHFNDCMCDSCIERLGETMIHQDIIQNLLDKLPPRAARYFVVHLDKLDKLETRHRNCEWNGIDSKCACGKYRMLWKWDRRIEVLSIRECWN